MTVLAPIKASGYTNSDYALRKDDSAAVATHSWAGFQSGDRILYLDFPFRSQLPVGALVRSIQVVANMRTSNTSGTPSCTFYMTAAGSGTAIAENGASYYRTTDRVGDIEGIAGGGYIFGTTTLTTTWSQLWTGSNTKQIGLSADSARSKSVYDLATMRRLGLLSDWTARMRVQWYRSTHAASTTIEIDWIELWVDWTLVPTVPRRAFAAGSTQYKTVTGAVTPTSGLVRRPGKQLAGGATPAGSLTRRPAKTFTGSVAPSSTLATLKAIVRAFAGTITPAAVLVRRSGKTLGGAVTPAAGVTRSTAKTLAANVTPTATVSVLKAIVRAFAGAVTPTSTLVRRPGKQLAGAVTPTASIVRATAKALTASVTPTAALAKRPAKTLAGSVTPTSALSTLKAILRTFTGAVTPSSVLARRPGKTLAGNTTPSSTLARRTAKTFAGAVAPTSTVLKRVGKILAGTITAAGTVANQIVGGGSLRNWAWTVRSVGSRWSTRGPRSRWDTRGPDQ